MRVCAAWILIDLLQFLF